jgi:magnesium chelatase family protein
VLVTRANGSVEFPARFTLVAAANPCPCGYRGDQRRCCTCQPQREEAYRARLSGPLLDRVDIRLTVPRLSRRELLGESSGETSASIRERVEAARDRQRGRFRGTGTSCNAQLPGPTARREANLEPGAQDLLSDAVESLGLTGRGFDRALKVARTIADLQDSERVTSDHLGEALAYRGAVDGEIARA